MSQMYKCLLTVTCALLICACNGSSGSGGSAQEVNTNTPAGAGDTEEIASSGSGDNLGGGDGEGNPGEGGTGDDNNGGSPPKESCQTSSWIAGVTELCNGHLVYRDYVYDDHGAANGFPGTPYAAPSSGASPGYVSAGSARYPAGAENTADIVRLELWREGDELVVEFELNTLYEARQTLAAIAIDSDSDAATGDESLLGLEVDGADRVHVFGEGDPVSNLIRGRVPLPEGDSWRVWAVTAQADGTVMNVAFRGIDERASLGAGGYPPVASLLWDEKQAAALQAGDISAFAATVNVVDLNAGVTRKAHVPPGFYQRVYTSEYTLAPGEGVSLRGVPGRHGATSTPCEQYFNFLGKYQPYAIYIPKQVEPHGLQMRLHGCGAHPVSEVNQGNYQQRFGEDLNMIIASPLGRGASGFYSDISERDVLDVMNDVIETYAIETDRVVVGGTSMGGYGALRMAALYPHRFAAGTNWVGFPGDFFNTPLPDDLQLGPFLGLVNDSLGRPLPLQSAIGTQGNMMDYLGNLRQVPFVHLYAAADELVHVTSSLSLGLRLRETPGLEFDFYEHAPAEHLSFVFFDDWRKEAAFNRDRRLKNPAHIVFRTDAYLDYPEYDIRHDRAYWLSEIVAREKGTFAGEAYSDLNVRSFGCGHARQQFESGADAGFGPVPWARWYSHVSGESPVPAENRLEATFSNVASLQVDVEAACLGSATHYDISSDGPVSIRFSDGRQLDIPAAGQRRGVL